MAKHHTRLPKSEVESLFHKLSLAICGTNNIKEAAELLRDLLSYQEAEMIAKRLKIAEMILKSKTYGEIIFSLKVSSGTIARVQEWLKISGEGYRLAVQRTMSADSAGIDKCEKVKEWNLIKRHYPAYFWPELLLENIIKSAGIRQREKIRSAFREIAKAKEKTKLYRKINNLLVAPLFILSSLIYLQSLDFSFVASYWT